ncbi:hypothetical protein HNV12_03520 [Methanococcoides sp. SA1]|nr:hypothetical protein [Methanococcoides sp. SA1]
MKRGQFNFVWLFAILAGGAILALAIWGALQTGDTLRYGGDTQVGKSISILTNPLQTGFAESSYGVISFQQETRINNICLDSGFGKNDISVATRSGVGEEWNLAGGATSIHNKYIFSEEINEGLDYSVFSKAFDFPYEVSDLIFLISENYCFLNAPENVEDDILGLGMKNVVLENCSDGAVRVCFGGGVDCDMFVYGSCSSGCDSAFDEGRVVKRNDDFVYVGSLLYAAIFSDKEIYDCNVKRLLYRAGSIADVLIGKTDLMDARACNTNLKGDLISWKSIIGDSDSDDLVALNNVAKSLDKRNDREVCGVW